MANIGISSFTYPWAIGINKHGERESMSAPTLVAKAIDLEVDCLQFGDNMPLHEMTYEERKVLAAFAKENGIQIEVGTRGLTHRHILEYIQIAIEFEAPFIRVVIDDGDYEPDVNEVIYVIRQLLPILKEHHIILAIENHDRFTCASLVHIIESTDNESVGICMDTANSLGAGEGVNKVLELLGPYTVNLHIKDITIRRLPTKMGFIVMGSAAGDGDIDIPFLIESLLQSPKLLSITLEIWSDFSNTIEETIAREEQWAQKSISYLKTCIKND